MKIVRTVQLLVQEELVISNIVRNPLAKEAPVRLLNVKVRCVKEAAAILQSSRPILLPERAIVRAKDADLMETVYNQHRSCFFNT
jgi:hypothetical protein